MFQGVLDKERMIFAEFSEELQISNDLLLLRGRKVDNISDVKTDPCAPNGDIYDRTGHREDKTQCASGCLVKIKGAPEVSEDGPTSRNEGPRLRKASEELLVNSKDSKREIWWYNYTKPIGRTKRQQDVKWQWSGQKIILNEQKIDCVKYDYPKHFDVCAPKT
ncbi:uncharacterized protein HD556DRAFT_1305034 [Suillus plorans]|uniref:Uncharacterized protein n=1 Tax=Suillus plorans TaxID=116603 RepID=A0A9P7DQ57_9AGAM|nr:uncharacterized protein HD556DRAFT_1305034 [Suillus plorans]KAG1800247.1 hypothetical protein HD556DRAFT_1305034 [Suillus plorans]